MSLSNKRAMQIQDNLYSHKMLDCKYYMYYMYYVFRWVGTLTPARVTRWGGMISTPDAVLQAVIKRALLGIHPCFLLLQSCEQYSSNYVTL